MARKPTEIVGLQLRFSERLRWKIEQAAWRNNRSMNQEIVHRLEESFARKKLLDEIKEAFREERAREAKEVRWDTPEQREAALKRALDTIEASYGRGSITRLPKKEHEQGGDK